MNRLLLGIALVFLSGVMIANSQVAACDATGKQVVARRWDTVLGHEWEMVRDCRHPEWPARAQTVKRLIASAPNNTAPAARIAPPPVLVHAGENVTLWQQAAMVQIQMSGIAEQAAHAGERIQVRVMRHNDDGTTTATLISGTVRATGDVEMDQ